MFPAAAMPAAAQSCRPDTNQVAVHAASGRCAVRGIKIYRTTAEAGLGDEPIDSIEVGPSTRAVVCGIGDDLALECTETLFSAKNNRSSQRPWTFLQVTAGTADVRCTPKDTEIAISAHLLGLGPCMILQPGRYESAEKLGLPAYSPPASPSEREKALQELRRKGTLLINGHIQMVTLGRKAQAKLCGASNFQGVCRIGRPWDPVISDLRTLGSIELLEGCAPGPGEVALFTQPEAFGPCVVRGAGEYPTAQAAGWQGQAAKSIYAGAGAEARVCSKEKMKGNCFEARTYNIINTLIRSLVVRLHRQNPAP